MSKAAWQPVLWKCFISLRCWPTATIVAFFKVGISAFLFKTAWGINYHRTRFIFAQGKGAKPELVHMILINFAMSVKPPVPFLLGARIVMILLISNSINLLISRRKTKGKGILKLV